HCLSPGAQPGDPANPRPGQVFVIVLPQVAATGGYIPPEQLTLSAELRAAVLAYLDERRPLGTTLEGAPPSYRWISVQAELRLPARAAPGLATEVQRRAQDALLRYLNPATGGPRGTGWPFGRDLHVSEVYGLLQRIPDVEFVDDVGIGLVEPGSFADP